ncbi:DUF4012 domain-containing protein [Microbacterium trichothecenolyticum]|uniref:DUF4012 domain-containing protein n=1 Tax=Microbacterium trichothecenolyticum TaxID=69370 RepID=A0ABU0TUK6_MICTR|nr:DUF4012 domain-containing protein [Microbacterium trichothecenolyticum]MDQ1123335.1 hypothetical protein [Microbacterium trichothecenolyticum]
MTAPAPEPLRRRRLPSDAPAAGTRRGRVAAAIAAWTLGACAFVAFAFAAISLAFLHQAGVVRTDLLGAQTKLSFVPQIVANRDIAGLNQVSGEVLEMTDRADAGSSGPLWDLASSIPVVKENTQAVQELTAMTRDLTSRALPPTVALLSASDFSSLAVEGGGINLEPFRQAEGALPEITAAFTDAKTITDGIDRALLLPIVTEPLDEVAQIVDQAAPSLTLVQKYLPSLLAAAGGDGPKTYLVVFQNNAEIRATGGNPAASSVMVVDNGRIQLKEQSDSMAFYAAGQAGRSALDLPESTLALYPDTFTRYSQDFTFTPDFPTTARLFESLWKRTDGSQFDGVMSIDPVVLSHLLEVLGPVDLPTGEQITAENAVKLLLSDAYQRYGDAGDNGRSSDVFFATVSSTVFARLAGGQWNPVAMFDQLTRSAQEQRINLWFADEQAQALVTEAGLDGGLRADNTASTQLGIYLNDFSIGKLEYHLKTEVSATCSAADRTVTVAMTMRNDITDDITNAYTLGFRNKEYGLPQTTMMLDTLFFAPPGATITAMDPVDGDIPSLSRSGVENANTGESRLVTLGQGETRTVSYTVQLPGGALGPLDLRHTPTASDTPVSVDSSCDPLLAGSAG